MNINVISHDFGENTELQDFENVRALLAKAAQILEPYEKDPGFCGTADLRHEILEALNWVATTVTYMDNELESYEEE